MDIILASRSPRRRALLEQVGLKGFKVVSPDVDEHIEGNPSPAHLVEALSQRKAQAVLAGADEDDLIIAADTVVVLDGAVLGKPADEREAFAMLSALSGNSHRVYRRHRGSGRPDGHRTRRDPGHLPGTGAGGDQLLYCHW